MYSNKYSPLGEDDINYLKAFISGATRRKFSITHLHTILGSIVRDTNNKPIKYAEIGSHVGSSALTVKYFNGNASIFCYDAPNSGWGGVDSESAFRRNLSSFSKTSYSVGNSQSKLCQSNIEYNGPYDIFLVDGDHSSEGARIDLHLAYKCVKKGGYIIFDDTSHHSYLKSVFEKFCKEHKASDYCVVENLTAVEIRLDVLRRGVAIMRKFYE
jgi:hypothetical protein